MSYRTRFRAFLTLAGVAAVALGVLAPAPAQAWWRGGVAVGIVPFPFFVPPVAVGPPVYYGPPPAYYGPPPPANYSPADPAYPQGSPGGACYAGAYVCPLDRPLASG